jgi:hypothetical protein
LCFFSLSDFEAKLIAKNLLCSTFDPIFISQSHVRVFARDGVSLAIDERFSVMRECETQRANGGA